MHRAMQASLIEMGGLVMQLSNGFKAVGLSAVIFALVAAGTVAQSTASTPDPYEGLTIEDAIATIEAQATQIAQLEQRIISLSGGGSAEAQSTAEVGTEYELGQVIDADVFDITVTGAELVPSIQTYETLSPRGVFAIVYFDVTNTSNSSATFPYDDLKLSTSAGQRYDYDSSATIGVTISWFDSGIYDDLQPGLTYQTAVIFDISPTATGLELTTSTDFFRVPLEI